jgi:nitrogen regulatory protein PII
MQIKNEMKTVFISYNQALTERIEAILDHHAIRGFTRWVDVQGRGTHKGDPHMGTHTWPAMNSAILAVVEDRQVDPLLASLSKLNSQSEMQGLRAFVWNIEGGI